MNLAASVVASAVLAADFSFFDSKWGCYLMECCGFRFDGKELINKAIREGVVKFEG